MASTKRQNPGIYVEILVRQDLGHVWHSTQDPARHQRWDLRFTSIGYLPRASEDAPQRFLYTTRIGAGLRIAGEGETTGSRHAADGSRTSALRFWSDDPKSLIRAGSGYWRYVRSPEGTRFFTWYDYDVRFGALGRVVDRWLFRPVIGWATAWSFDRLRLWLERGLAPEATFGLAAIHALARIGLAFVWFWQGLFPKLLWPHPDEASMIAALGLPARLLAPIGWAELAMAGLALGAWHWRGYFTLTIAAMAAALVGACIASPSGAFAPFNAVTLNITVALLAAAGSLAARAGCLPSASRCLRQPLTKENQA